MRIAVAAAMLLALAACNQRGGNEQNQAGGLPTPGARPGGNSSADLNSDQSFRQSYRSLNIGTCVNGARTQGGARVAGIDFRPYCTCFVDRSMAGLSVEQLTSLQPGAREERIAEQCARENLANQAAAGQLSTPAGESSGETGGSNSGGK